MVQLRPMVTPAPITVLAPDHGATTDFDATPDDHIGPQDDIALQPRLGQVIAVTRNDGPCAAGVQIIQHIGKQGMWMACHQGHAAGGHRVAQLGRYQHEARRGIAQGFGVAGVGGQSHLAGLSDVEIVGARDQHLRIRKGGHQFGLVQCGQQGTNGVRTRGPVKSRINHGATQKH